MNPASRIAAWSATALLTAGVADGVTEWAEDFGWLGGTARDGQHESVLPVLLLGLAIALALMLHAALTRPGTGTRRGFASRAAFAASTFAGSAFVTFAMEAAETRYGGVSPFDPRSVVVAHAPVLAVAFVAVALLVHAGLRVCTAFARRAGAAASAALAAFARRARSKVPAQSSSRVRQRARCRRTPLRDFVAGAGGFRAPPASASFLSFHLFAGEAR